MSSVRKRGKKWSARWYRPDKTLAEKGGFPSRDAALQFAKRMEVDIHQRQYIDPITSNLTLIQYIDEIWKETLVIREETRDGYAIKVNKYILPTLGHLPLNAIRTSDIKMWIAEISRENQKTSNVLSPKYIESIINLLGAILNSAVQDKFIRQSPLVSIKRSKATRLHDVVPLEYEQVEELAKLHSARYRPIIWTGYFTGMRPSEILGLTIEQIDFEKKTIKVDRQLSRSPKKIIETRLKTKASYRTIGLSQELAEILVDHIKIYGLGPHGLIFTDSKGREFRYKNASAMFRKYARRMGLPPRTNLHVLRHTCVSTLIREGCSPKQIQVFVGHSSISETMDTYGHLFEGDVSDLADRLDQSVRRKKVSKKMTLAI